VLGLQTNPIVIKYAMAKLGLIGPGIRLPMTWLDEKFHAAVDDALRPLL
jgi:4-hydroxy-tetrahydrodipicolinate synthase